MYNLHKVIIIGNWGIDDRECLQTIAIETRGMRVCSLLVLYDKGFVTTSNKEELENDAKDELYADMYDESNLRIKVYDVYDGANAAQYLSRYIDIIWDEDLQIYWYDYSQEAFDLLNKYIYKTNGKAYLNDYYSIFSDYEKEYNKPILQIMKDQGLKTENLIPDSQISMGYFLSVLVERMLSK